VERAASLADRGSEALGRTHLAWLRSHTDVSLPIDEARREGERAVSVFEELGDDRGLSRAWHLVFQAHNAAGRKADMAAAAARGVEHARRAGDVRELAANAANLGLALFVGPTPIPEAIEQLRALLEVSSSPAVRASVEVNLGRLLAAAGRVDEARELAIRAKRTWDDLGSRQGVQRACDALTAVEYRAGDWAAAERASREWYELCLGMGDTTHLSTAAAVLANALFELGRDDEALAMSDVSKENTLPGDLASEVAWRRARAKVLARRGEGPEAERLAWEAIRVVEGTDDRHAWRPTAYETMAEVLALLGRRDEAVPYLEQALELREQKGDLPLAERDRRRLAELRGHVEAESPSSKPPKAAKAPDSRWG
jgi:tetratricopeptide (TPR) repeat protein